MYASYIGFAWIFSELKKKFTRDCSILTTKVHRCDNMMDSWQKLAPKSRYLTKANELSFPTSGLPYSMLLQYHVREAQHLEPIITSPMKVMRPTPCPAGLQSAPFQARQIATFPLGKNVQSHNNHFNDHQFNM